MMEVAVEPDSKQQQMHGLQERRHPHRRAMGTVLGWAHLLGDSGNPLNLREPPDFSDLNSGLSERVTPDLGSS